MDFGNIRERVGARCWSASFGAGHAIGRAIAGALDRWTVVVPMAEGVRRRFPRSETIETSPNGYFLRSSGPTSRSMVRACLCEFASGVVYYL